MTITLLQRVFSRVFWGFTSMTPVMALSLMQIMDEFVKAVMGRWPTAVLQFEDFNLAHAHPLLNRYRYCHTVFNDDIQAGAPCLCMHLETPERWRHVTRCSDLVLRHLPDWQGTAGTAVAGIYGALAVQGKPVEAISEQRVVMVGAGSAGMGVVQMLALGMVKHVSFCCK